MRITRFDAFRSRDFRLWWIGFVISVSGLQMLWMVEGWLIYELSGSKLLLGLNGLAQAVPATILSLFGGVLADKVDQRKLLMVIQALQAVILAGMAALALTEQIVVWHIIAGGFVLSAIGSFGDPARQSMFPHLIDRKDMPAAISMNAVIHPGTRIIAPPVGGFILAAMLGGTDSAMIAAGTLFSITAGGLLVYALVLQAVHMPPVKRSGGTKMIDDLKDGVTMMWRDRIFAVLVGLAYYNMFFGLSLSVLFPVFAKDILDVGPGGLSLLFTSMGVGSLVGALVAGSFASPEHQRWLLITGSLILGGFLILFALSPWFPLSLFLLFGLGAGGALFNVGVQQNLQMLVRNEFRGRVMGVWSMVHTSVRPLGETQFGGMAALVSAPFALMLGGGLIIANAVIVMGRSKNIRALADLREAAAVADKASVADEGRRG